MKERDQIIEILHLQRDAGAYLRYVRETNPELTVTLKMHLHDTTVGGGGDHGVNGEWKRAKKVYTRFNLVHSIHRFDNRVIM